MRKQTIPTIIGASAAGFAVGVLVAFRNSGQVTIQTVEAVLAQRNIDDRKDHPSSQPGPRVVPPTADLSGGEIHYERGAR